MKLQDRALLIISKIALADDHFDCSEESFLKELIVESDQFSDLEKLVELAQSMTLEAMCEDLVKYEDRFIVAFRAYLMANIDLHFDIREKALYMRLIQILKITREDMLIIRETERSLHQEGEPQAPPARLTELYQGSSFAKEPVPGT